MLRIGLLDNAHTEVCTRTFGLVLIYHYFHKIITRLINGNARRMIAASLARIVYLEATITRKIPATCCRIVFSAALITLLV